MKSDRGKTKGKKKRNFLTMNGSGFYFKYLLLTWRCAPRRRYGETFVATVEESEDVTAKYVTDVFHPADSCTVGLHGPVGHVERGVHHRQIVLFGGVLGRKMGMDIISKSLDRGKYFKILCTWLAYQVSFRGHGHQDEVIADSNLLALGSLLRCWMHRPPTSLA